MIGISEKLVPASELRRITAGSFEQKIESISKAVTDHLKSLFGEDREVRVVATYPDHVVAHAAGKFHRVSLRESDSGVPRIVDVGPLQVEEFESAAKFASREAEEVVDLYLRGAKGQAREKLSSLIPIVITDQRRDEMTAVEGVVESLKLDRPWRSLFADRGSQLKRFIVNELEELEENKPPIKFRALYEGSIDEDKLSGYATLVDEDLEIMLDRLQAIRECASQAFESAREPLAAAVASAEGEETFSMYENFATDLIDDLGTVREAASRVAFRIEDVACRGKLRDVLAEAIHPYEVASRFVVAVANRLTAEDQ